MRRLAYVAFDRGSQLTLQPLAARLPGAWLSPPGSGLRGWSEALRAERIELLACGTSDSSSGRASEREARLAASELGIPTLVIEDFPGNFTHVAQARAWLLCVESEFAAALARAKAADATLSIHVGPGIRYDGLRRRLAQLRVFNGNAHAVLWIGQPETAESLETLKLILPALRARSLRVWLRAHPRDEGYGMGVYDQWCKDRTSGVEDVSAWSLEVCFRLRPRLVIPQFSSAAVEAGFWGIPSLNVLLPEGAGGRLAQTKGYAVLPWCVAGAAFLATCGADIETALGVALDDETRRRQAQECFDRYFMVEHEGVPGLVNVLYNQGFL